MDSRFHDISDTNILNHSIFREIKLKDSLVKSQNFRLGKYIDVKYHEYDVDLHFECDVPTSNTYIIEIEGMDHHIEQHVVGYMNLNHGLLLDGL